MFKIAIIGGVGSGKSTFIKELKEIYGSTYDVFLHHIDLDILFKTLLNRNTSSALRNEIVNQFPNVFTDGWDFNIYSDLMLKDPESLKALPIIATKYLMAELEQQIYGVANNSKSHVILIEGSALIEWNLQSYFDMFILLKCPITVRMQRLVDKGWNNSKIGYLIQNQLSEDKKIEILTNDKKELFVVNNVVLSQKDLNSICNRINDVNSFKEGWTK